MPNPKRRHSNSRRKSRRAHDALPIAARSRCPRCGAATLPHTVCEGCGYYRGTDVLEKKEEA